MLIFYLTLCKWRGEGNCPPCSPFPTLCYYSTISPLPSSPPLPQDVYIKIWLLNKGKRTKKWKSSVKQKIPTPVFNESFKFDLGEAANIHDLALELVVMEQDRFSRAVTMGVVYIGMGVPHHTGRQHWQHLIAQPSSRISNWHPILPVSATL